MTNEAMHTRTPYEGEIMKARMYPPMDENEYGKAELMPGTYRICRECTVRGRHRMDYPTSAWAAVG